jgi:hypothetical protein
LQDKIKELKDEEKLYKSSSYYSQKIELDKLSREKDQKI